MSTAVAIIVGALCGIASFLPLFFGLRLTRRVNTTSNIANMGALLFGVIISIAILFIAAIVVIKLARDATLPFVFAEAVALIVAAIVYGVVKLVRK